MGSIPSQITSLTIVYSAVYSGADQRKHQSSASLAFVWEIHRGPVNSPHKGSVTRKMIPFDDVIMLLWFARDHFCHVNQRFLQLDLHNWQSHLCPRVKEAGGLQVSWECEQLIAYCSDVILSAMASQITSVSIVCSTIRSGTDHRKQRSSASLAFGKGMNFFHLMTSSIRNLTTTTHSQHVCAAYIIFIHYL